MADKLEHVRFLLEQEQREVTNFWTRTNVFLVLHTVALGSVLSGLSEDPPMSHGIVAGAAAGGILTAIVWLQVHRLSEFYSRRWKKNAEQLVDDDPELQALFRGSIYKPSRPAGPSATNAFYAVIVAFLVGWLLLVVRSVCALTCA